MVDSLAFLAQSGGLVEQIGGTASEVAHTFKLHGTLFVSQLISFCIVLWALNRWAFKPILGVLESRKQRIEEGLANAEKIRQELASTEAARQEIIKKANEQANALIAEARAAAARISEQESQKAVAAAEQIVAKAREATEADRRQMMAELRQEIGQLVVKTTAAVAGKVLTAEDQQRLAEETSRQLAA